MDIRSAGRQKAKESNPLVQSARNSEYAFESFFLAKGDQSVTFRSWSWLSLTSKSKSSHEIREGRRSLLYMQRLD
ncbi:hypothetical protein V6N13_057146 [Hibiscus sabdariffa]|uniref:Uncharacterized protein n=2 Tax=Hibiscus sabdariffa TaxID=183260 RepID=A0ABR1ZQ15_9ROSI